MERGELKGIFILRVTFLIKMGVDRMKEIKIEKEKMEELLYNNLITILAEDFLNEN